MNPLDNVEQLAQRFVEGTFRRFFVKKLHPVDLTEQLALFIETEVHSGRAGHLIPARYQILVHPLDYAALIRPAGSAAVVTELYSFLTAFAAETNVGFDGSLQVELAPDKTVRLGQVQINTQIEIKDNRGSV